VIVKRFLIGSSPSNELAAAARMYARTEASRMADDVKLAAEIVRWIARERRGENGFIAAGATVERMDLELWRAMPDSRRFGRPMLRAAAAKAMQVTCCRYDLARQYATGTNEPPPVLTAALSVLLGDPCQSCLARAQTELRARVVDAPKLALADANAIVASAAKINYHGFNVPCTTCHEWRRAARSALRASAEIPTLKWHRARPAAAGPVRTVKPKPPPRFAHDLEGGETTCGCVACRQKHALARPGRRHDGFGAFKTCGCEPCRDARVARRRAPADPTDRAHARAAGR
jgi:hypothetical protein